MSSSDEPAAGKDVRTREFLRLLARHDAQLQRFLFVLAPNWSDAQDLMQEVHLRLWDQFDEFDPAKDFGAWSRTIAYYLVLAHRKKAARHPQTQLSEEILEHVAQTAQAQAGREDHREEALFRCVQQMSESARQLLLRSYEGLESLQQIAASLDRTYEATRKMVFRLRRALAKCIREKLQEDAS